MSEHTFNVINYIFMGIGALIFFCCVAFATRDTVNEQQYMQGLIDKIAEGNELTSDEREALIRYLRG